MTAPAIPSAMPKSMPNAVSGTSNPCTIVDACESFWVERYRKDLGTAHCM